MDSLEYDELDANVVHVSEECGEKKFGCSKCNKKFATLRLMKIHFATHLFTGRFIRDFHLLFEDLPKKMFFTSD